MEFRKIVLVLLGPQEVDMASLGTFIAKSRDDVLFFSPEQELWYSGGQRENQVKQIFHNKIYDKFEEFRKSTWYQILVVNCVNDLQDAECVTSAAQTHDLQIYRALIYNSDGADTVTMGNVWRNEVVTSLVLPNTREGYIRQRYENFNTVLNYFKRMNVLSFSDQLCMREFVFSCDPIETGNLVFPVTASPNYIQYLLLDSERYSVLRNNLLSILRVSKFEFSLPLSFVHCARDVTWVGNPKRYHVTSKANGVRCLLFKVNNNSFLINANQEIFPCDSDIKIPNNTVLDGELLPSTSFSDIHPSLDITLGTSVCLIHDILAVSNEVKWTLPFSRRAAALNNLNLNRDITAVINKAKASHDDFIPVSVESHKQRTRAPFTVFVVLQAHHPSTPAEIESCLTSSSRLFDHSIGLEFTPETPYNFGEDSLSFQWQPTQDHIHCCIDKKDLESGKRPCHLPTPPQLLSSPGGFQVLEDVIECKWSNASNAWQALVKRDDKVTPDGDEIIDHLQIICQNPYPEWQLRDDLQRQRETFPDFQLSYCSIIHPALTYEFDELYSLISHEVVCGHVSKTSDPSTMLEVFHCCSTFSTTENPIAQLCRNFVLHPSSKTIVTMPFVQFFADPKKIKSDDLVEATLKFDGLLGIAFQWGNEVMVSCQGTVNSSHVTWSKDWIIKNCHRREFMKGYTYVFEIIRKESMNIVRYPFEGLVLLSITDTEGHELPYDTMMGHGINLGFFMVTPRMFGRLGDVSWYCGARLPIIETPAAQPSPEDYIATCVRTKPVENCYLMKAGIMTPASASSGAYPTNARSHEGWVLRFINGTRKKVIHSWWYDAFLTARFVHPQIVWLLEKYDKFLDVFWNLPEHFLEEVERMRYAMKRLCLEIKMAVKKPLEILKKIECSTPHCPLSGGEEKLPSQNARRRRLNNSPSTENTFQDSKEDVDCVIERLRTQLFESLNVMNPVSRRLTFEQSFESRASSLDRRLSNASSYVASTFLSILKDTLDSFSTNNMKHILEKARNILSHFDEDKFPIHFVEKIFQRHPSAKLLSYFDDSREVASVCIATCEQILESVLSSDETSSSCSPCSAHSCIQTPNQHTAEQEAEDLHGDLQDHYTDLWLQSLDYIRPLEPAINGYEPSSYFKEAWGKHWKTLPMTNKDEELKVLRTIITSLFRNSVFHFLPVEVITSILKFLDGSSLVMISRVASRFHDIVTSQEVFQIKISEAKTEHERQVTEDYFFMLGSSGESYGPDSYS